MAQVTGKLSALWQTMKEDRVGSSMTILTAVALVATGVLPLFLDITPGLNKFIDGVRWGAIGIAFLFLITVLTKFTEVKEKLETIERHMESDRLIDLQPAMYLSTLLQLMTEAKRCVMLMYLTESPTYDDATRNYWMSFVELLAKKTDQRVPFQRIATIGNKAKLEAILLSNQELFNWCEKEKIPCRRINYQLAYYPFPKIKPPQADIVDDAVLLFSPYAKAADENRLWTRNKTLVRNLTDYYQTLWGFLESANCVLLDFPNRDDWKYRDDEVLQFMNIARKIPGADEEKWFATYLGPRTSLKFAEVRERLKTAPPMTSL